MITPVVWFSTNPHADWSQSVEATAHAEGVITNGQVYNTLNKYTFLISAHACNPSLQYVCSQHNYILVSTVFMPVPSLHSLLIVEWIGSTSCCLPNGPYKCDKVPHQETC